MRIICYDEVGTHSGKLGSAVTAFGGSSELVDVKVSELSGCFRTMHASHQSMFFFVGFRAIAQARLRGKAEQGTV